MAVGVLGGAGALLSGLRSNKIAMVQQGDKVVTKPKTIFGKVAGAITGRTAAYNEQERIKETQNNTGMNIRPLGQQLSGSMQFGAQTKQANLPTLALFGGVIIALAYFFTNKKSRRRR
jgi:hypothetical protein